jgi:hypothetical protein
MLLSMVMAFPAAVFAIPPTQLMMVDPVTGSSLLNYTNNDKPPFTLDYPLGYVLVNVSIADVEFLASYQLNITWDPTLLNLSKTADVISPSDNIFSPYADTVTTDVGIGTLFYAVGILMAGPPYVNVTYGTLCQIKFNVTKIPTPSENWTCPIHFVTQAEYPIYTMLVSVTPAEIPCTLVDATYKYEYVAPALLKPRLVVSPPLVEMGKPTGPPIIGTSKVFFKVDIVIEDIENASMLTAIQFAFKYKTDLFRLVPLPDGFNNATEGNFMNKTAWAPYGTDYWTAWGGVQGGKEVQYVLMMINPNNVTSNFDWGVFPDTAGLLVSERIICTFYFEATLQNETPWYNYTSGAFDIDYLIPSMPAEMFLSGNDEWIPANPPVDGDYTIYGWVLGLMIDVYTQYPKPYGGQDLNQTSDMFFPQGTVVLHANLTYNGDPVQNKPVTFQVWNNDTGYVNFTKTAVTDENGVATIMFGIEWPCNNSEALIFGKWTVVASTTVREIFTWDWLWFKVYWLVYNFKVTADPTVTKDTALPYPVVHINVTFISFREQPVKVLIHVVVMDNLQVPIGEASIWVTVGDTTLHDHWCTNASYLVPLSVPIPKWAFVGESTVECSALSNWPSQGGYPFCPEATTTFTIIKYTPE